MKFTEKNNTDYFRSVLVFFFTLFSLFACKEPVSKKIHNHFSDSLISRIDTLIDRGDKSEAMIVFDSAFARLPYVSVVDQYQYYDLKRKIFTTKPKETLYNADSIETAILYADSMISLIEENHLAEKLIQQYTRAFSIKSDLCLMLNRNEEAVKAIARCKLFNQQTGDSCMVAQNSNALALIFIKQNKYEEAANLLKETIRLTKYCKYDNSTTFLKMHRYLDDLGFAYRAAKLYDSALKYHFAAEKYILENKYRLANDTLLPYDALATVYNNICAVYREKNEFTQSEIYGKKALRITEDIFKDSVQIALCYLALGELYIKFNKIKEAAYVVDIIRPQLKHFGDLFKIHWLKIAIKVDKANNNQKARADYSEVYMNLKDSLYRVSLELLKRDPEAEYQRLDKKRQVELLQKDNRIQQNKTTAATIVGALLAILAVATFYYLRKIRIVMKKKAIIHEQLVESEKELKKTMVQKEIAEKQLREEELFFQEVRLQIEHNDQLLAERRKISEDMHDDVSSSLAALKFYIEDIKTGAETPETKETLTDISAEVKSIYENARRYMHNLKANMHVSQYNLLQFLKDTAKKFNAKTSLSIELNIDEEKMETLLNIRQQDQLYHIINESISNVIKYAGASKVKINIHFENETCTFSIADNGKGFDPQKITTPGLGLKSIKNRVEELGGVLSIDSNVAGTEIRGAFPVN